MDSEFPEAQCTPDGNPVRNRVHNNNATKNANYFKLKVLGRSTVTNFPDQTKKFHKIR